MKKRGKGIKTISATSFATDESYAIVFYKVVLDCMAVCLFNLPVCVNVHIV